MNFNNFLTNELNEEQRKAVKQTDGPILVIAGAGSGKTRVITSRIINLIMNEQVAPESIVALTFTNKAAQEMRERVQQVIGIKIPTFIGTFHSYCLQLLKKNSLKINLSHFTILDGDDQISMLKKLIEAHCPKKIQPRQATYQISLLKNNLLGADNCDINPIVKELYYLYEREKTISNCLDFDDLLLKTVELFSYNDFRKYHQGRIQHILIDEYQDTNIVQHELLKQMSLDTKKFSIASLCAVGDEDQSIYSWRGATIDNMLNFKNDFPTTKLIKIEQNYRSVKPILDAANTIIKHNNNRHPKNLWSTRSGSKSLAHLSCMSGYQEADIIASTASLLKQEKKLQTCAILYRTHFQSRLIEEALIKKSIPYKIIGGVQFYERKEIKDLLAYIRLICNPFDRVALFRILNCPPRRLGETFAEEFRNTWNQEPFKTFSEISNQLLPILKPQQMTHLISFLSIFNELTPESPASQAIKQIVQRTGYIIYLKEEYEPEDAQTRIENVQELINAALYFEEQGLTTVEQFIQEVSLLQDHMLKKTETSEYITLMTIHAAKGLEFDTIIMAGLEEGLLPSSKSLENESNIEEERRLLYVAITRARNKLLLLQAEFRNNFGSQTYQLPSRFLKELPEKGILREDCSYAKPYQTEHFLSDFLEIRKNEPTIQTFRYQAPSYSKSITPKKLHHRHCHHLETPWKKLHPVSHKKFGVGIIQEIETKPDGSIQITANFKDGIKKIDAKFLQIA